MDTQLIVRSDKTETVIGVASPSQSSDKIHVHTYVLPALAVPQIDAVEVNNGSCCYDCLVVQPLA